MNTDPPITELILRVQHGDPAAWDRLVPLVYDELHRMARRHLLGEQAGHTLGATGLVHEAYLKLVGSNRLPALSRSSFFAITSRAMRQVLIDHARKHGTAKRGGGWRAVPLTDSALASDARAEALIALDDALNRLAMLDERLGRVVECRYFGGLTEEETAEALGVTSRTVRRDWVKARLWLYGELQESIL
jgi:RNA polymerase sigma factor (TIGR02999 family)